jgi:hypothetical protein
VSRGGPVPLKGPGLTFVHEQEATMKTTKRTTWVATVIAALRQAVVNLLYG